MADRAGAAIKSRLRFWRRDPRPWWAWAGLGGIAALALVLYTWSLSRNGMGNPYYAAAVKSGSVSWKAFFFGSLDPGSFITVDKLPASLWVQELSARLFGFSSWSMLLPQALAGVASVLILYRLVRRWQGEVAGLLAALALALTPVAVVMFRFNNPDAFLTLLLLAAAWALWSALERGSTWSLVGCGALVGFAFLAKMLEALVVLPAFVLVYLICGPPKLGRRLLQVLAAGVALVVSCGWWVAIVELWPAASRPYIGGSSNNSVFDLVFSRTAGYLSSSGGGAPGGLPGGGAGGGANFSGGAGWLRMFNSQLGGQISWLVPLALAGMLAGLWITRHGRRNDRARAGYLLWGAWTLLYLVVFSLAKGVLHPYYAVILAPSIAALVGGGSVAMWQLGRQRRWLSWLLPVAVAGTAVLSAYLLRRTPSYLPGLSVAVAVAGLVAALGLGLVISRLIRVKTLTIGAATLAAACVLAGPAAYSLSTVAASISGPLAAAGPAAASQSPLGGGFGDSGGPPRDATQIALAEAPPGMIGNMDGGPQPGGEATLDQSLVDYLLANKSDAEFLVAVQGAGSAEAFIIATGEPVMAMGGFSGSDPWPTLAQFQELVSAHKLRYVLVGGGQSLGGPDGGDRFPGGGDGFPGGGGGSGASSSVVQWAAKNGTAVDSGEYGGSSSGGTLYRLW